MICPRCELENTTRVGDNNYLCNTEWCRNHKGKHTQFEVIYDNPVSFPYTEVFPNRERSLFYKMKYVEE